MIITVYMQDMLEAGLEVLSPRSDEATEPQVPMYFDIPGAADTTMSYQEWRDAFHTQSQGVDTGATMSQDTYTECPAPSDLPVMRGHVPVAWESSSGMELDSGLQSQPELNMTSAGPQSQPIVHEVNGNKKREKEVPPEGYKSSPRLENVIRNEW